MFDFYSVGRLTFGSGQRHEIARLAKGIGTRYFVVSDGRIEALKPEIARMAQSLEAEGARCTFFENVHGEPDPKTIDDALHKAQAFGCDAVLSVGGGSVIDTGKAVAGLVPNGGPIRDYLEGVGTGRQLVHDPLPHIALPTTSGTGAEVTKNAVITSVEEGYKKSFRHEKLLARLVVIDPELTLSLPPSHTAASGMDALTQCIESFLTKKANPITDAMALGGIRLCARHLADACENGQDIKAREGMAAASVISGLCLANSGLGAVHGIAASLGAHIGLGHGLACAILLDHIMEVNMKACAVKMGQIGVALTGEDLGEDSANARAAVEFVRALKARIGIPPDLRGLGIQREMVGTLARDSAGSSMSGNPVDLPESRVAALIEGLIGGHT